MRRLSYNKVFSKYDISLSDRLAQLSYSLYKRVRTSLSKRYPLKDYEKFRFEDHHIGDDTSADMPLGFNYSTKENEEGYVNLRYIDFYDYLPKEELGSFKRALNRFALRNKLSRFGPYHTAKDDARIDSMGRYVGWQTFSNLHAVILTHSPYLANYAPEVAISLRNLSSSFLVVKYRFYVDQHFNDKYNSICKTKYLSYSDISRQFNIPWYKPHKFGRSMYTGNDARSKELYLLLAELKWKAYRELRQYFSFRFEVDQLFPPTFETYSTNIRPDKTRENLDFWNSVMIGMNPDYAPKYNACVCWDYKCEQHEGISLTALCGGNYTNTDHMPEIAEHELSDMFAVYMTASSIRRIAERDIAISNKTISKVIRNARTSSVLRVRVNVEKTLYYSYRFISEFSGETIDYDDVVEFKNERYKDGSITASCLKNISKSTTETKTQIDVLLNLLNDAADCVNTRSNMSLQWFMMAVTILSLIVAVIALFGFKISDLKPIWDAICAFFQKA